MKEEILLINGKKFVYTPEPELKKKRLSRKKPIRKDHEEKNKIKIILNKTIKTDSGCIEWTGSYYHKNRKGGSYPLMYFKGKKYLGNRLVWILNNGEIEKGMFVCHRCDNRKCINIKHLFLGTPQDNMSDMKAKKRSYSDRMVSCKNGHLYADGKFTIKKRKDGYKERKCIPCAAIHKKNHIIKKLGFKKNGV